MRLSRRPRRSAGRPHRLGLSVLALASLAPSISQAFSFDKAPSPNLDFSNLGKVGVAGDFSGISLYEYDEQTGRPPSRNGSESLLAALPNGALASILSTDASIRTMCTFKLSNGDIRGVVIGGNFTSLDGTESTAAALYDTESGKVTSLKGLQGEVSAVYCDEERDTVFVGGNFKGSDSTNAMAWVDGDGWTNLPFAGFNGPVEAITKTSNGHIIFGGSFTGLGNATSPSEPDGQTINLSTAKISAENSASGKGNDPENIVCSGGSKDWLVQDGTPGSWNAEFGFGFEPTKLRLWNTHQDGRGTKTFRLTAFPINGIMNMSYIDPDTGNNHTCTSECPLSNNANTKYQDFHFINTHVGMNRFQIDISDWYGAGAGLSGIELYQDNIFSYAIKDFNEPSCGGIDFPSTASKTGPWSESPSLESSSKYLKAAVSSDAKPDSLSVVFTPNIKESGNYSVNLYTPGCQPDGTCDRRGRVNITGTMSQTQDDSDISMTFYQTNNFDKYDNIYYGYIDKTTENFKPSITLTPIPDDDISDQMVVAQRVGFNLVNTTGGLNGLFDFDPKKKEVDSSDFSASAINQLGASFDDDTGVKVMITSDDVTFIGGNFTSDEHKNIVAINKDDKVQRLDGGLNGQVFDMHLNESKLYVGGEFDNTLTNAVKGMSNVAVFDIDDKKWTALGGGVDGRVDCVVPLQVNVTGDGPDTAIVFTGAFSKINSFDKYDEITVNGMAIWLPSQENWLQNLDGAIPSYSGVLTAALMDVPNEETIYAGSISYAQAGTNGAATLDDEGLGQFPVKLSPRSSSSSASSKLKRSDIFDDDFTGVVTGLFHDQDDWDLTVLGGHFTAQTNDSTVNNLVIIDAKDDDKSYGLPDGVSSDSTFVALEISGNTLYAGGKVKGTIDDNKIGGLVLYDLKDKSFGDQPSMISGGNATVSVISARPDHANEVYVGGSFTKAGALDCPGICLYNADSRQWIRPGSNVGGDIYCMMWSDKKTLVVGGALQGNSGDQALAVYKPKNEAWEDYPGSDKIPGPVTALTPASTDNNQIWVAGTKSDDNTVFLMKYDGKNWHTVKHTMGSDTVIRSLQVWTTTESHDDSDLLGEKEVLLLNGAIELDDFGMASAAIYNGTDFTPYALTTSSNSNPGSIAKIFSQKDNFLSSSKHHMALGFVVLIGLAISLGLILLLVAAGILLDRLRKRREGYTPAPTSMYDRGSGMQRIPPQELFQSLGKGHPGAPQV